jgi:hypothetical protein
MLPPTTLAFWMEMGDGEVVSGRRNMSDVENSTDRTVLARRI